MDGGDDTAGGPEGAATAGGGATSGRDETPLERRDRQFDELLQELRVSQTGVQVLFGFLLGVPFTQRFASLDADQRLLYFGVLVTAAVAVLCLLAPSAWHRALFAQRDKAHLVQVSHGFAIAGLACVAAAVSGAVALIGTVIYPGTTTAVVAGLLAAAFVLTWYLLPLRRRVAVADAPGRGVDGGRTGTHGP